MPEHVRCILTRMPALSARYRSRRVAACRFIRTLRWLRGSPRGAVADRSVDGSADRRWQRHQHDLVALAVHLEDPAAVFLAEVGDVGATGPRNPQAEQAEHRYQREVERVRRQPGGLQHRLELQMGEPQGRRLGRHPRPAHMFGRRATEPAVDHAGAVAAGHDRDPAAHRRWCQPAHLQHPARVQLQVRTLRGQRIQSVVGDQVRKRRRSDSTWVRD
jgi:hypothetical protein